MKNKIIIAGSVLCMLASSTHASAIAKPNGWYFKGSYEDLFTSSAYTNLSLLGGSIGYKKGYFRSEGQLSYAQIRLSDYGYYGYGVTDVIDSYTFGLHGFLDFDNQTIFSPYIGLGIEKTTLSTDYASVSDVFAISLVGARAYITNNMALDVGYKSNLGFLEDGGVGTIGLVYHFN